MVARARRAYDAHRLTQERGTQKPWNGDESGARVLRERGTQKHLILTNTACRNNWLSVIPMEPMGTPMKSLDIPMGGPMQHQRCTHGIHGCTHGIQGYTHGTHGCTHGPHGLRITRSALQVLYT